MHVFFETADPANRGIQIARDGNGYLHFILWTPESHDGAGCWLSDWRAGEWHHLAATWSATEVAVYVDGRLCGQRDGVPPPVGLGGMFYVGSTPRGDWQVDAVFDELRISDVPRLGNSDSCGRILVADSGNDRVQAFDSLGRFVTDFGSSGSGPGQFNNPQGLAVHSSGRVIVADSGNDRLQLLSFDWRQLWLPPQHHRRPQRADRRDDLRTGSDHRRRYRQPHDQGPHPRRQRLCGGRVLPTERRLHCLLQRAAWVAVEPDGNLVVADTGNRRVVTARGILSGPAKIWLPLVIRR